MHACEHKLEGIICKQADAPYNPGRGVAWAKVKCLGREEFMALGHHAPDGLLHYAGQVGSGFSERNSPPCLSACRPCQRRRRTCWSRARDPVGRYAGSGTSW